MKINYRRCVACRRVAHRQDFFRVVRSHKTHALTLDKGIGRSAYVCKTDKCLNLAQKKNRMSRALKVQIPHEIFCILKSRLEGGRLETSPYP